MAINTAVNCNGPAHTTSRANTPSIKASLYCKAHCSDVTRTSWHLTSTTAQLIYQHFTQAYSKEDVRTPHRWLFVRCNGRFPAQRAINVDLRVLMSWRLIHYIHDKICMMDIIDYIYIYIRSRNCSCLVTWFCDQLIAKPGNKTATVSWSNLYIYIYIYINLYIYIFIHA